MAGSLSPECWNCAAQSRYLRISIVRQNRLTQSAIRPCMLHIRGSVAAPTAGLHFTQSVLDNIAAKGIDCENVCLHVGAGTFLPVKSSDVADHPMHREPFVVTLDLLKRIKANKGKLIAVGTTPVRTLESLYYVGVSCIEKGKPEDVGQWAPYEREYSYSLEESLDAIIAYLENNRLE